MDGYTSNTDDNRKTYCEDDRYLVVGDERFAIGELSANILNDDFFEIIQYVYAIQDQLTQYKNVIEKRQSESGSITYTDIESSFESDILELKTAHEKMQDFVNESPYRLIYGDILNVLYYAKICLTPLIEARTGENGQDIFKYNNYDASGYLLENLFDIIKILSRKSERLICVEQYYKPVLLHTLGMDNNQNDKRTNAGRASDFISSGASINTFQWGELGLNVCWSILDTLSKNIGFGFSFSTTNDQIKFVQHYETKELVDVLFIDYMKIIEQNKKITKCVNCGKYFVPENRFDEIYCDRQIKDTGKTCKDIGAGLSYKRKLAETPYLEEKQLFYSSIYAAKVRKRRGFPQAKEKALNELRSLMGEVDQKIVEIEQADGQHKQELITALTQWFGEKKSEIMRPRKKAQS